ncbi:MAG: twin-arginine translocation signal domain-containing protein [Planctomycetales bacterium]|nr:twin-arginine translocation signal domain-containing protein [Planctomycetales bacterium]
MSSRAAAASVSRLTRAAAARFAPDNSRRRFLQGAGAVGAAGLFAPGAFAEMLTPTPRQTEGPFYPDHLPLDTDNDLLIINDGITPAVGEVTHVGGRVLDAAGNPVRNALVEIWQVDGRGVYLHSQSGGGERDANFQGYGRFLTNAKGEYYFRTIRPVPYPGRTPHIHFAISRGERRVLTTQMYIKGEPRNERDGVLRGIRDKRQRESVLVDLKPLPDSTIGEVAGEFNIVLGMTPADPPRES